MNAADNDYEDQDAPKRLQFIIPSETTQQKSSTEELIVLLLNILAISFCLLIKVFWLTAKSSTASSENDMIS